jgi:hypothetical protein
MGHHPIEFGTPPLWESMKEIQHTYNSPFAKLKLVHRLYFVIASLVREYYNLGILWYSRRNDEGVSEVNCSIPGETTKEFRR